jgi:hypothetical protein
MEGDAHLQNLFYTSFRVPSKGALPPRSFHTAPTKRERHSTFMAHNPQFIYNVNIAFGKDLKKKQESASCILSLSFV